MNTHAETSATSEQPKEITLQIPACKRLRRHLTLTLRPSKFFTVSLTAPRRGKRPNFESLVFNSLPASECRVMLDDVSDRAVLIVDSTHFEVNAKDARKIVELFGIRVFKP